MEKWVMLRGYVPEDRDPIAVFETDMWTELWREVCQLASVTSVVAYLDRRKVFGESMQWKDVVTAYDLTNTVNGAQMVFHRGGFRKFHELCRGFKAMYYGAGVRNNPPFPEHYKYVLHEADWVKPAIDSLFMPLQCKKEFDVCYIANATQSKIKSIDWFYETVPKDLKVLHLCRGNLTNTIPDNVTVMEDIAHTSMPFFINKCKIGIVPYWTGYDSAPRVIPEMQACGLPIVVADTVKFSGQCRGVIADKESFWHDVWGLLRVNCDSAPHVRAWYEKNSSMAVAARTLVTLIQEKVLC